MSGQYEFGLEKVLTFRRVQKDLEAVRLSESELELERLQVRFQECRARIARLEEEMVGAQCAPVFDVTAAIINRSFIRCLREEETALARQIMDKVEEVDRRRNSVIEKARDQKIVEKLRQKDLALFQAEQGRKDAREADERAVLRKGRAISQL